MKFVESKIYNATTISQHCSRHPDFGKKVVLIRLQ